MIEKIKKYKLLLSNFSYLTILKSLTLVLPLVTFPYLISVLGAEKYGLVMWAWAIAEIFIVFIKFGFDTLGVKLVSETRSDDKRVSYVFSGIMYAKLFLLLLSSIIFYISVSNISLLATHKELISYFYLFIIFESLFPVWFFQGIENIKIMALLVASIKLLFALFVFIFIRSESSYLYVSLLYALGSFVSTSIAYTLIFKRYRIKFLKVKINDILNLLKESSYLFIGNIGSIARDRVTVLLIEHYMGLNYVAYFDLSMRIINILLTPFHMVSQVLYPHVAKTKDIRLLKKVLILTTAIAFLVVSVFLISINEVVYIFSKNNTEHLINIMKILIFIIPIGNVSSLLSGCFLVVFNQSKWVLISILGAICIYIITILIYKILSLFNIFSFSILVLIFLLTEMLIILGRMIYIDGKIDN